MNRDYPNGWAEFNLNEILDTIENGSRPTGGIKDISDGIPSLGGEHLDPNGGFKFNNLRLIPKEFYKELKHGKIKKYDVLLVKDGATTGKVSIVDDFFPFDVAAVNEHLFILRGKKDMIDQKFLFYHLLSPFGQRQIENSFHGAAIGGINTQFIKRYSILLPPLTTQRAIVSTLEKSKTLMKLRQKSDKLTTDLLKALFYQMFLKKGYETKTLAEICLKITDGTHRTPMYVSNGVPFLRVTDLTNSNESKKFISLREHKELIKRCKPEKGDILYSKNGTIGIAKLVDWDYEFSIFVSLCLIKPNNEMILSKYLECFLNTPIALNQALKHSKTGTITNLHLNQLEKITVPVPPLELQQKFVKITKDIENLQKRQSESRNTISTFFDSLTQNAFNGELIC